MNVLTIAGRITKDAETRYTGNGSAVVGFTVASDVGFGDKKHAIFVRVSDWRKSNEALAPHLTKGSAVTVTGEFDLREYEHNGEKRTSPELRLDRIALQSSKRDQAAPQGFREAPQQPAIDDDIPF